MITLEHVKKNKQVLAYIEQGDIVLNKLVCTYHGLSHVNLVSKRAGEIAQTFSFSKRKIEIGCDFHLNINNFKLL